MKNVIILITESGDIEAWSSLTKLCREHDLSYNYLKAKKYPFSYKGCRFEKRQINDAGQIIFP